MMKKVLFLYILLVITVSLGVSPFRGIRHQQTPINWDIVTDQYLQGRVNLTSQEPSITVPIEIILPQFSVIQVGVQPHNDKTLWGLPLKFHYSGLTPSNDFKLVGNVTKDDAENAGENIIWLYYQRIAHTSDQINFTITLSEHWNNLLTLSLSVARLTYEFSLDEIHPSNVMTNIGYGSNQSLMIGFLVYSESTGNVSVSLDHYQEMTESEFTLAPGKYYEIEARTIIFDTSIYQRDYEEPLDAGHLNITLRCELGKNSSGFVTYYFLRPYVYMKQTGSSSAPGFELVISILLLGLLYFRRSFFVKNKIKNKQK